MFEEFRPLLRARTLVIVLAALLGLGYGATMLLYSPGGGLESSTSETAEADVRVRAEVVSLTPNDHTLLLRLKILDIADAVSAADGRLDAPLRVTVAGSDGVDDIVLPAEAPLGRAEVTVGVAGEETSYPFDNYSSDVTVSAALLESTDAGVMARPLTVQTELPLGVPGWETEAALTSAPDGSAAMTLKFQRSVVTQVFALLLVAMAVALGALSLTVGIFVATGRQPVDSSILGWGAGLLFALLALRYYLPGDPPIGSAIDVFVYVWATLLTFLGLMLVTVEWMRRRWPTQGDELVVDAVPGDDIGETPT